MIKFRKWISLLAVLMLVLGLAACGGEIPEETQAPTEIATEAATQPATEAATEAPEEETTEEEIVAAPDFTAYDFEGNPHTLAEFRGKPVILNFWATWCGPCKREMPEIQKAYETYGDQINFVIVDLTDGTSETVEQAADYVAQQGYTFPVFFDTDLNGATTYGVSSIPVTYFIDSDGNFVAYYLGSMDESIMQQGIDLLLGA